MILGCCKGRDLTLNHKDIVACRPAQHEDSFMKNSLRNKVKPEEVGHPVFMIIAYPQWNGGGKRVKKSLFFHYIAPEQQRTNKQSGGGQLKSASNAYELTEAVRIRDTWVHSILTPYSPTSEAELGVVQVTPDVWSPAPSGFRRLLIVLNPSAGVGRGLKVMRSLIGPVLQEAGIEYEVLVTEKQGHAHEIVRGEPDIQKR